jgi:hypothetical protein
LQEDKRKNSFQQFVHQRLFLLFEQMGNLISFNTIVELFRSVTGVGVEVPPLGWDYPETTLSHSFAQEQSVVVFFTG